MGGDNISNLVFRFKKSARSMRDQFLVAQATQQLFMKAVDEGYAGNSYLLEDELGLYLDALGPAMAETNIEVVTPSWFAKLFPRKKS